MKAKPARRRAAPSGRAAVAAYLAKLPPPARAALGTVRRAMRAAAPRAEEGFSYRMPCFRVNGRPLVWYAAFARHASLFPTAAVIRERAVELKPYRTAKGTVQFPFDAPPPARLVAKLVRTRLRHLRAPARPASARRGDR